MPVVFLNSPNLSPYFSLNKLERIWLLIFSSWLCLINSHFLITKCHILYVLYKEKLVVDNRLALKGLRLVNSSRMQDASLAVWLYCMHILNQLCFFKNRCIYYIDMSILPKNKQLVFSIRNYIRDKSEIFSISSLVKIPLTLFSHIYVIKRNLHVDLNIWNLSFRGKMISFVRCVHSWNIFSTRR